ncbi:MAG: hypothetical protein Fur0041_02980 [Bacteroidia bacterium]
MRLIIFIIVLFSSVLLLRAQGTQAMLDSLDRLIAQSSSDTFKVSQLKKAAFTSIGYDLKKMGRYAYAMKAMLPHLRSDYHRGITYLTIGAYCKETEKYDSSLICLVEALKLIDRDKYPKDYGNASSYAGFIQEKQNLYRNAIRYHLEALRIREKMKDTSAVTISYMRLGTCYGALNSADTSLFYLRKAIYITERSKFKKNLSGMYNNMAITLKNIGKRDSAIFYYLKAYEVSRNNTDTIGMSGSLINIGSVYNRLGNYKESEKYLQQGYDLARKVNYVQWIINAANDLSELYKNTGDFSKAYNYLLESKTLSDSLQRENNFSEIANLEARFQNEKKERELEIQSLKIQMKDDELKQSNNRLLIVFAGFILALIALGSIVIGYRRYKMISEKMRLKNAEIEMQKTVIEQKNKDITDSITYARKIQRSLLASEHHFSRHFNEYFILYKPRDIVSGDFYWAYEEGDEVIIATADCTGHGVPGAFMSLIAVSKLNEIVREKKIRRPDEILNQLRKGIIETLSNDDEEHTNDGIDMTVCRYIGKTKLQYASANNSPWLLRGDDIQKLATDKFPVGPHVKMDVPFTLHEMELQSGDIVYTLTDGFADQFGGKSGKKFKYKQLAQKLAAIGNQRLDDQKQTLEKVFEEWKGTLEQIDDICIIGLKV